MFDYTENSHRRYNILTGEWILVSPHRSKRPWQGQIEKPAPEAREEYDEKCYLCPGNERAGGIKNPDYTDTFVFTNDFAALQNEAPEGKINDNNLLIAESEKGTCRVICFSPKHNLTLPEMEKSAIIKVVDVWIENFKELGQREDINYVQIFENKGEMMGCSNPHPHGQIWATKSIPNEVQKEGGQQLKYFNEHQTTLLSDYLKKELEEKIRIVVENENFVALVPFWAVWPFETIVISKRAVSNIMQLNEEEKNGLADILKRLTSKYDNLFEISFPYSAGIHQAPTDGLNHPEWHLHLHFYPPLLRSASVKKFMVGYEMLGNPQRDITPEWAAERLRNLPEKHYKDL